MRVLKTVSNGGMLLFKAIRSWYSWTSLKKTMALIWRFRIHIENYLLLITIFTKRASLSFSSSCMVVFIIDNHKESAHYFFPFHGSTNQSRCTRTYCHGILIYFLCEIYSFVTFSLLVQQDAGRSCLHKIWLCLTHPLSKSCFLFLYSIPLKVSLHLPIT